MKKQEEVKRKSTRLKIAIIILVVLLVISAGGIAARFVYLNFFVSTQETVTIPDNLIGEETSSQPDKAASDPATAIPSSGPVNDTSGALFNESNRLVSDSSNNSAPTTAQATLLELYQGRPDDNAKFQAYSLLPGDKITKYFCVRTSHKADTTLYFQAEITEQVKRLGDVLHIQVTHLESGEVLCDGFFSEISGKEFIDFLSQNAQNETISYYRIDVSLDTSVGNEYQEAKLTADFNWFVKDKATLAPPKTGDWTDLALWVIMAGASVLLILFTLCARRKKEDKQHG